MLERLRELLAPADAAAAELPVPAPWAIGVAVLALLAFGVFVGATVSGARPRRAGRIFVAASTQSAAASTSQPQGAPVSSPPRAPAETTPTGGEEPAEESSAEAPAAEESTSTTTSTTQAANPPRGNTPSSGPSGAPPPGTSGSKLPPIKHIFLIVLSDQGERASFEGSQAPYLAHTLRKQGELIENYYAVSGGELANGIALISGQGPNPQTVADCPVYEDVAPGVAGAHEQVGGSGCVFPARVHTLADQLASDGKTWHAYVEDMGKVAGEPAGCEHPAAGEGDSHQAPSAAEAYVTWRNPFVYFHSLIDGPSCASNDVGLGRLTDDLRTAAATPSLSYIVPSRCHDGSPQPCAPGQESGLPAADAFLREIVPEIERSPAYKRDGLIAITFDQAPQSGPEADSSGCCLTAPFPNMPPAPSSAATTTTTTTTTSTLTTSSMALPGTEASPPGGGRVGLLLISKFIKPGSISATDDYDHFSLLRSIENLFGLQSLGYAAEPALLSFDASVYDAYR